MTELSRLIAAAKTARSRAIAPYSGFLVGAALETADGTIIEGCNIENASYGLTVCAERVALLTALAAGERRFQSVTVVTSSNPPASPCGPCRQLLWEYCGDIDVHLATLEGQVESFRLSTLFPRPFDLTRGEMNA
jgi:cytidine deaminase